MADSERYIILPRQGVRARRPVELETLQQFPSTSSMGPSKTFRLDALGVDVSVVDTVAESSAKLVDISPEAAARLNAPDSPVRALKEVFYPLPQPAEGTVDAAATAVAAAAPTTAASTFKVEVSNAQTGAPIGGCKVSAFSDFQNRIGTVGFTDAAGTVTLSLPAAVVERITANPEPGNGFWSGYLRNVPASGVLKIKVPPFAMPYTDCVRHYFGATNFVAATGVVVGVIDTGCGPHADLNIIGGRNTVTGEPAGAISDGQYHGTHVAGLVGARGTAPNGVRGLAPGVGINAYRVFGANARGASNYAILKAMIHAANDECDIINLSLGGGPHNEIVEEAIVDARNQGMLVVIAAGNGYRAAVSFPAAYSGATAVSAMGREGTVPPGSAEELQIVRPPYSTADALEFIAGFSNVGPQIAVTGPGVGAISTLPNNRIGPLSGTSMAAPVIAGAATCLLSQNPGVHGMIRDRTRSAAIERLLQASCAQRGFGLVFEGLGLPQSPTV
ncbi:S8 family serine peptidase [Bradyrhizobium sp.]|uniref:S8 family peptidase n=1 Tax=Bradyrhizobium sp. TaxID=376 RepID=UPI001D2143AA|nr:S8 family serine peptidase [Bradyrhizobium sp.]MBI5318947.1 S8 family serine peptidase [Bradyrhizobium sp.]